VIGWQGGCSTALVTGTLTRNRHTNGVTRNGGLGAPRLVKLRYGSQGLTTRDKVRRASDLETLPHKPLDFVTAI
jgi:hypothetical protein